LKYKLFSILKIFFFLGLGILLIWLVIKDLTQVEKIEIKRALKEAHYFWIILPVSLGLLSHISRAIRWKMLLQPLGHNPKLSTTFYAVMAGYLANFAIPRLGEITRCGILNKYEKIPFSQSFGTVIAERTIDLFFLVLLFFLTIISQFDIIYSYALTKIISPLQSKLTAFIGKSFFLYLLIGLAIAIVLLFLFLRKTSLIKSKIKILFSNLLAGISTIKNIQNPFLFLIHSVFIWLMYYLMVYLCFFAFANTIHLSLGVGLPILVFGSVGTITVPGGIGAYPLIVTEILKLYGISATIGIAFGWIVWTSQSILILILGLFSFVMLALQKNKTEIIH